MIFFILENYIIKLYYLTIETLKRKDRRIGKIIVCDCDNIKGLKFK